MSTPCGGGYIIFAFAVCRPPSGVRRYTWFPLIKGKSIIAIITKFGMQDYWVSSLPGIAFGEGSSIAIRVIAT